MPIEIKELHVRIQVNEDQAGTSRTAPETREDIIEDCLDELFTIMNDEKER